MSLSKPQTVTVLVPCYNVEKYVDECLSSIQKQTYPHLEVICINDGSTDGTLKILKKYEQLDKRFRIIDKHNSGYGASMNIGINNANGDYVGIVESDDFVESCMFEKLITLAIKHDLDIARGCYFQYRTSDKSNELVANDFVPKDIVLEPISEQSPFYQAPAIWSAIYKRQFLDDNNIRFLETPGASFQDTAFAFKVYCCAKSFMMLNEGLLHYRIDNEGSSVNNPAKVFCVCDEYEEMWKFAKLDKSRYEAVKRLIPILQLATYTWNYNRLSPKLRKQFLNKWAPLLRSQLHRNLLNLKNYKIRDKIKILKLAYIPSFINTTNHV